MTTRANELISMHQFDLIFGVDDAMTLIRFEGTLDLACSFADS